MADIACCTADAAREVDQVFGAVYDELRRMAHHIMRSKRPGQTLQPTILVHEAFLRLTRGNGQGFANRAYFFGAAGRAMRRILIEEARRKKSLRRGGQWERVPLDVAVEKVEVATDASPDLLLSIEEALRQLAIDYPDNLGVVELLFFAGLTVREAAEALGISERTVKRRWAFARAWLYDYIS